MNSAVLACFYLCTIISFVWCEDDKDPTSSSSTTEGQAKGATRYPNNPNEGANDDGTKKIIMRVTVVLFAVCVIVGLYFVWRWYKSKSNVRAKAGGKSYYRVRNSLPANDVGGERGEDMDDEETLYNRTEATSQF